MTAFAAILSRDGRRPDPVAVRRVSTALVPLPGVEPSVRGTGECTLLAAPSAGCASGAVHVDPLSGVAAVGDVLLEDAARLSRELLADPDPGQLGIVVSAFLRWGPRFTERLSGEFAFILWSPHGRILLCARDGLGVRLVHAAESRGTVVVSNRIAAVLCHPDVPDTLDERSAVSFLARGVIARGRTAHESVRPIPAGHTLTITSSPPGAALVRHWWFPQPAGNGVVREEDVLEHYKGALEAAVADRITDGRCSILLSGGIDSTTIAAAIKSAAPATDVHGFTATYSRFASSDELTYARAAADCLGIDVTAVEGDAHEALHAVGAGVPTPWPIDEPTLTDWRALLRTAGRHSATVLLGEDGDALLTPPGFRELRRATSTRSVLGAAIRYTLQEQRLPYLGLRLRERVARMLPRSHGAGTDRTMTPTWLTEEALTQLKDNEPDGVLDITPTPLPPHPTRRQLQHRLGDQVSVDLAALIAPEFTSEPLQVRCPLLDSRVIRCVVDAPAIPWMQRKRLPRRAYRHSLPAAVLDRPKQGVRGFQDALVQSWQLHNQDNATVHPSVQRWVDRRRWLEALRHGDAHAVCAAWRVLQLSGWMARWRELTTQLEHACTR